jgi:Na+-transporting methylmalonyl-CoA/oxaloacetate decarboxylase gamma subunit
VHNANGMILFLIILVIAMYFINNCNQLSIKPVEV